MPIASSIVHGQRSRVHDKFGSGQFGVSRDHGSRTHQGLDIITTPRETIFSPIQGMIIREAFPYKQDPSLRGIIINGTGDWSDYEVKIFYAEGLFSGQVWPDQHIGFAQDLAPKYPGITNHVHVEVRCKDKIVSPQEIFAMCF